MQEGAFFCLKTQYGLHSEHQSVHVKKMGKKPAKAKNKSQLDVLERPQRAKYVRRSPSSAGCVFCKAASESPSPSNLVVFKTKNSMVVLNKYPYNSGHILVIPKRHVSKLEELSSAEYQDLMKLFRAALGVLEKEYAPQGVNAGINLGSAAGAGIPGHLHWHIVPRWSGDTNFFPLVGKSKVVIETVKQTYTRLRRAFKVLKIEA